MKQKSWGIFIICMSICYVVAQALSPHSLTEKIHIMRGISLSVVVEQDSQKRQILMQQMAMSTKEIDEEIANIIESQNIKSIEKEYISILKTLWTDFKKTQETEINPILNEQNIEKAAELTRNIQSERFIKICNLLENTQ